MKKALSLLLIAILALSLAACSGGSDGDDINTDDITATITVQVEDDWREYYEAAAARVLERFPNATIEFIEVGSFDHLDTIDSTSITNEDVADVFAIPADRIYGLAQNDALAALDAKEMAKRVGGFSNYDAGLGGMFKVNGEYLAFPMNIETLIIFANAANAEAAGIDLNEPIEFTELEYEDMLVAAFNAWFGVALTNTADIELLGKDSSGNLYSDMTKEFSELNEEQQGVFTALFEYWQAHHEVLTDLWDNEAAWGYMNDSIVTGGPTTLRLDGPWETGGMRNRTGEDLEILPITQVTVNGNPLAHWQGGWGLVANARIEEDEQKMILAEAMIEEIVNTDYAVDFFEATGKILENVDASVYIKSDLSDLDKKVIEAVIESYQEAPGRPLFNEWGQVWTTWETALLSWSSENPQSVEDAYKEVKASFDAMMSNF